MRGVADAASTFEALRCSWTWLLPSSTPTITAMDRVFGNKVTRLWLRPLFE